jgi:5-formyltetrahydrofolate cyclo-ligase
LNFNHKSNDLTTPLNAKDLWSSIRMSDPLKTALRNTMKQIRANLSIHHQIASSNQVCARVRMLDQYRKAKRIGLYHAVNGEINLNSLWSSAPLQGKSCYFPVLQEDLTLLFLPATPATAFKTNRFGILEPDLEPKLALPVNELDLMILPLVAFDEQGTRLGMGAGYYDRTLKDKRNGLLVGVGYPFQKVNYIAPSPWDVPLDVMVTPKVVYWRQ